eukprot:m.543799 g.543799  ORF g.543799 m.543799 type:complete len:110 (-) comp57667_c0_seq87:28-357(-)
MPSPQKQKLLFRLSNRLAWILCQMKSFSLFRFRAFALCRDFVLPILALSSRSMILFGSFVPVFASLWFLPALIFTQETAMDPTATVALPFAIFDLSELHAELGLTQLEE